MHFLLDITTKTSSTRSYLGCVLHRTKLVKEEKEILTALETRDNLRKVSIHYYNEILYLNLLQLMD